MRAFIALTIVGALCGLTTASPLGELLERLLEKKEDHKRALYDIKVTDTSISGYPEDWGQCPTFDCTYDVSCGGSTPEGTVRYTLQAQLAQKVEFTGLQSGVEYTCSICIAGTTKCSRTEWACTTKEKGPNDLDMPCRSKIQKRASPKNSNIDKIEELLEQLRT